MPKFRVNYSYLNSELEFLKKNQEDDIDEFLMEFQTRDEEFHNKFVKTKQRNYNGDYDE